MTKEVRLPAHVGGQEIELHFMWDEVERVWVCKMEDAYRQLIWQPPFKDLQS